MRRLRLVLAGLMVVALTAGGADEPRPRLLFLLADGFNRGEFFQSYLPLKALGYGIDIAGIQTGTVFCATDRTPDKDGRDAYANVALRDVDPAPYFGLIIPGGYSPGELEKHAESLAICRAFMDADKVVAGVCHGPRLLMRAGLLKNRTMTCLYSVADELADAWKARDYGTYLDQPVVVDGNLVTSRYPNDMKVFARTVAERLAAAGGLPLPTRAPRVLLVTTAARNGHERWALSDAPDTFGVAVRVVDSEPGLTDLVAAAGAAGPQFDAIIVVESETVAGITEGTAFRELVKQSRLAPIQLPAVARYDEVLAPLLTAVRACGPSIAEPAVAVEPDLAPLVAALEQARNAKHLVLALRSGFDDAVVSNVLSFCDAEGGKVTVVGQVPGPATGLNGMQITPDALHADAVSTAGVVIIAPGGIFPEKNPNARQAEQPPWMEERDALDKVRVAWLLAQWKAGATLVTVGFDSLRVGRDPAFKGHRFASSDQAVWSFPKKTAGAYSDAVVEPTAERLVSVKSALEFASALRP